MKAVQIASRFLGCICISTCYLNRSSQKAEEKSEEKGEHHGIRRGNEAASVMEHREWMIGSRGFSSYKAAMSISGTSVV
uniref:Uncharacterized protein n=1 Tax=Setaria digitata TaxID=48799 RepID=A0A915Q160_9BILA